MPGSDDVRPETAGVKLTYDDFVLFPDDGKRHELIDGEHYVTPSPNIRHQRISGRLYLLIGNWLEAHPVGELFYAPLDVVFSHFDVVEPDLLYMSNARAAEVVTAKHVAGVPELVIEIGSPARGRGTKRSSAGCTSVWASLSGSRTRISTRSGSTGGRPGDSTGPSNCRRRLERC